MRALLIVGTIWLAACAAKAPPPAEPTYSEPAASEPAATPEPAAAGGSDLDWSEYGNCEACDYDCDPIVADEYEYDECMSECGCY